MLSQKFGNFPLAAALGFSFGNLAVVAMLNTLISTICLLEALQ